VGSKCVPAEEALTQREIPSAPLLLLLLLGKQLLSKDCHLLLSIKAQEQNHSIFITTGNRISSMVYLSLHDLESRRKQMRRLKWWW
jgi:hypothetical protein